MNNSQSKALFYVDFKCSRWLKWALMRLTVIDRVYLALTEQMFEITSVILWYKLSTSRTYLKKSTRVRCTRAHSQRCTAAVGKYEYLRVRCGTGYFWWRILTKFIFYCAVNWCASWITSKFNQSYYEQNLGVRSLWPHSDQQFSESLLQIALKWCVRQLTSTW